MKYTAEELKEILENHRRWLYNYDGKKEYADLRGADLYGANLYGANLRGADLRGVNGNLRHVKSLQTETYYITYTSKVIQIGCQRHTIKEWKNFDDEKIKQMGEGALEWWTKWKHIIMQNIELAPCEKTKSEDKETIANLESKGMLNV